MGPKPGAKSNRVGRPEGSKPDLRSKLEKSEGDSCKTRKNVEEDSSILHPSINLSVTGLRQVVKIFEKGTTEVQDLLSYECDVIYECKICRNLFRSVANFISHKRIYCTTQYQTSHELLHLNNKLEKYFSSLDPSDAVHPHGVKNKLKNPKSVIPRPNLTTVLKTFSELSRPMVHSRLSGSDSCDDYSVHLQSMQDSKAGVFQTLVSNSSSESTVLMKSQMQELYSAGPDNEMMEHDSLMTNGAENSSNQNCICEHCGLQCSSQKALYRHQKVIHEVARTYYLCPCCKNIFANTWSVHRHLFKVHHKTYEQVRKLRAQIKTKILQPGELSKGIAKKIKIVPQKITDQEKWDLENLEWMEHMRKDLDLLRCGTCGRKFERKAALKAHMQICQKRVVPVPLISPHQQSILPEKESSIPELKPKSISDNLKLLPVVALTALSPSLAVQNCVNGKENPTGKPEVPEKKIGIQVRMDYCKTMTPSVSQPSDFLSCASDRSNPPKKASKPNFMNFEKPESESLEVITIDDKKSIDKTKSCLEMLLTNKTVSMSDLENNLIVNNRSDSGNDSESQDDISIALDFSSDSVIDEDTIKLNMYDIIGINGVSSVKSNEENAFEDPLSTVSSDFNNCNSDKTIVPNKRKKSYPVKRFICSLENSSKTNCAVKSDSWIEKANDMDCVFRKENVKVTYINCKSKANKIGLDKEDSPFDSPDSFSKEMVQELSHYYDQKNIMCLLCKDKFDCENILLQHVAQHGNWLKFHCKWVGCDLEFFTKAECVRHVLKKHQSPNQKIIAHNFVELISKKDWKFKKIDVSKKRSKQSNVLLESVDKLKQRFNCTSEPLASMTPSPLNDTCDNSNSESNEIVELDSSDKEDSIDSSNTDLNIQKEPISEDLISDERVVTHDSPLKSVKECFVRLEKSGDVDNKFNSHNSIPREIVGLEIVNKEDISKLDYLSSKDESVDENKLNETTITPSEEVKKIDIDESSSTSNNTDCNLPTNLFDDVFNDSQCTDMIDFDPPTAIDKSEMDVELDDDHLRTVMMEMIFGQITGTSPNSSSAMESESTDSNKKRRLTDRFDD